MDKNITPKQARATLRQIYPLLERLIPLLGQLESKVPVLEQDLDIGDIPVEDNTSEAEGEMPEISDIERMAIILGVMQEAGCLLDERQRQIILHGILNRMSLPSGDYTGRWDITRQLDSSQIAGGVLSGMPGETRDEQIQFAYEQFYADDLDLACASGTVDTFIATPTEDFTGGAISSIHIDNPDMLEREKLERAEAIAARIAELGQDCIERNIRCAGVDPIINGNEMVVRAEGVTVYINMNYNIPSTPNIGCGCEGEN